MGMARKMIVTLIVCVGLCIGLMTPTFAQDVPSVPMDHTQKSGSDTQKKLHAKKQMKGHHSYRKKKGKGKKKHKKNKDIQRKFKKINKDEIKQE
jgi:hypothetical protein